ncbi:MAG: dCMP deaminase family protein [Candidatus Shapirobacteria bacterium]|nr:dCMP deaminase family protein [Candidatus Shapirobacteria bacterium]MDD3002582.1 dCMP deaminase family protein [Candidatus Shapirobacteria bacterium]MDD4382779.1 dCMP deaminase family protein [Candidatus Shapirobacteria bacterium]
MTKKEIKNKRPSWDEYFIKIAALVSERSTCLRHHVGAIIVKDRRILTTGYNGAPAGTKDCLELGCLRNQLGIPSGERVEICRAIHGEQNAIIQAAKYGQDIQGATMYCTHSPCIICTKMLINAGIKRLVTYVDYADVGGVRDLLKEAEVELIKVDRPGGKIDFLD